MRLSIRLSGVGFLWAWGYLAYFSEALLVFGGTLDALIRSYLGSLCGLIVTIVLIVFLKINEAVFLDKRWIASSALLLSVSTFASAITIQMPVISYIPAFTCGVSSAWMIMSFCYLFGLCDNKEVSKAIVYAGLIAFSFILLVLQLPKPIEFAVTLVLPFASALLIPPQPNLLIPLAKTRRLALSKTFKHMARFLLSVFGFGSALGCFRALMVNGIGVDPKLGNSLFFLGMVVVSLFLVGISIGGKRRINVELLYRLVFPMTVAAFLFIVFLPEGLIPLPGFLLGAGFVCFDIGSWLLVSNLVSRTRLSPKAPFGFARLALHFGMLSGAFVGYCVSEGILNVDIALTLVALLLVCSSMISFSKFEAMSVRSIHDSTEAKESGSDKREATSVNQMASVFGLTKREEEILGYLVEGRNAAYIERELMLSHNTVKTHIRHIYEKVGVNTRQDLLSLNDHCNNDGAFTKNS